MKREFSFLRSPPFSHRSPAAAATLMSNSPLKTTWFVLLLLLQLLRRSCGVKNLLQPRNTEGKQSSEGASGEAMRARHFGKGYES
ncbi:hypothetical protein E2C01_078541 [Portunus trituberculatus]|uniref:Uncharacterized protein n=1 Tax=Portunus trituberculatus TaxID=210409 RepID=A0A5B7IJ27_PORTR|nr:hypothetical protein [Portunus trituberculatus]